MKAGTYPTTDIPLTREACGVNVEKRKSYYFVKELLGGILSALILIIAFPIFLVVAILIKLDSPGPVIFSQTRVGALRRKTEKGLCWVREDFQFYKFRTMYHNNDPAIHKAYVQALIANDERKMEEIQQGKTTVRKLVNDPRITKVGKFLRKFSLDELPQFINVVRGEMSIVGPRPAIPYEVDVYQPWQLGRLQAKPGITGLQQVSARCLISFDEQIKYDLEYIENQSFIEDVIIIIKTPLTIIKARGAH